jgi:hypothetical protein
LNKVQIKALRRALTLGIREAMRKNPYIPELLDADGSVPRPYLFEDAVGDVVGTDKAMLTRVLGYTKTADFTPVASMAFDPDAIAPDLVESIAQAVTLQLIQQKEDRYGIIALSDRRDRIYHLLVADDEAPRVAALPGPPTPSTPTTPAPGGPPSGTTF